MPSRLRQQNKTFITDVDGSMISSLLLVNTLPNGHIQTVNTMKYHTRVIKERYGINFKYHYLRHTYGTQLAVLNTPTHILCNQMGHGNIHVTVIDQFGKDIRLTKEDDQHFRVTVPVSVSPQFFAWVFSMRDKVTIVDPPEVRRQMADMISEALRRYRR